MLRPLALLFAIVAVSLSACAPPDRPVLLSDQQAGAVGPVGGSVAEQDRAQVRALITPTGVLVGVLAQQPDGFTVRTPCGDEATVAWGTPLHQVDVVLDPGHGGPLEPGAVGPDGLVERDLNLAVARAVATQLSRRGLTVALTRTGDYQVPLVTRAELADRLDPAVLVSIHHNGPSASPSEVPGTEVFIQDGVDDSRRLGGLVHQHVTAALAGFDVAWTAASDAGVLVVRKDGGEQAYGMIRYPKTPTVLAELAYLSNPAEAQLLATSEYRVAVSDALADAIEAWFETTEPGTGFVDQARTFNPSGATGGSGGCVDPPLE